MMKIADICKHGACVDWCWNCMKERKQEWERNMGYDTNPHLLECNYREDGQAIGYPGCICMVVNKNIIQTYQRRIYNLREALLRYAAGCADCKGDLEVDCYCGYARAALKEDLSTS